MEAIRFLNAFGVNVESSGQTILQKKARMQEALARGGNKREILRNHAVHLLQDLWQLKSLPRDSREKTARTIELIIKSLLQDMVLPSVDWKKVANEAHDSLDRDKKDDAPVRGRSRSRRRLLSIQTERSELPRRPLVYEARSKSKALPGSRAALANTDLRRQLVNDGILLETRIPADSNNETLRRDVTPRRLFDSPQAEAGLLSMLGPDPTGALVKLDAHHPPVGMTPPELRERNLGPADALPPGPSPPHAFTRFHGQRLKWPPLGPAEILRAMPETHQSPDDEVVMDFVFRCSETNRLDQLYLFYLELAKAGVYVDCPIMDSLTPQATRGQMPCLPCTPSLDLPSIGTSQVQGVYDWTDVWRKKRCWRPCCGRSLLPWTPSSLYPSINSQGNPSWNNTSFRNGWRHAVEKLWWLTLPACLMGLVRRASGTS